MICEALKNPKAKRVNLCHLCCKKKKDFAQRQTMLVHFMISYYGVKQGALDSSLQQVVLEEIRQTCAGH